MTLITMDQAKAYVGQEISIGAWVTNKRSSGKIAFLQLRDGSHYFQGIVLKNDVGEELFDVAKSLTQETSLIVKGIIQEDTRSKLGYELLVTGIEVLGESQDYPITPKEHGTDFLMDHRHLWLRSSRQHAIMKIRNEIIRATYEFFNQEGFIKVDPPILTGSAPEGTTELFHTKYFDEEAYLSQSGQLYMEAAAMAFGKVFSFGPTFRAEKSKTRRHLIEFWMMEPEIAFADLDVNMDVAEDMMKYIIRYVLENAPEEMQFFNQFIDKTLLDRLNGLVNSEFGRVTYTEAIEILKKADKKFEYPVEWGIDLQTEHERYLAEEHFKKPVFVTDYPKDIKAFYMKLNEDGKTVRAMDLLAPGIGEIIGGSQREDNFEKLEQRIKDMNLNEKDYWWYMELRKYGSVPHSGYGLGFERAIMYVTGMLNIRDVIPFPRGPKSLEF